MEHTHEEAFALFEICINVSEILSIEIFQNVFGEHMEAFWIFWVERAKSSRVKFFYDNIDYIDHGSGKKFGAKKKFEELIFRVFLETVNKHGYKLVKK